MRVLQVSVLVLAAVLAMADAAAVDTKRLGELLVRLMEAEDGSPAAAMADKRSVCDNKDCGTGRCGKGENPHDWDEAYYCFDCNGPNNDKTNGGRLCEIADPCGQKGGSNPCAANTDKPNCKTSSMKKNGYFCANYKRSALSSLLEHLEEDADQEEYHEVRMMMARENSAGAGLATYVRAILQ